MAEAINTKQDKTLSNEVAEALSGDGAEVHALDDALLRLNEKAGTGGGGEPGFSPTVEVTKTGKVTTVTITDKEGVHTATINDGADGTNGTDGQPGAKGDKGEDGVSPTISAVRVSNGVQLTITDKNGSHSAVINDGIGDGSSVATFADVPNDGKSYLRRNGTWVEGATKQELAEIGSKVGELIGGGETTIDHSNDAFSETPMAWKVDSNKIATIDPTSNIYSRKMVVPIALRKGDVVNLTTATYGTSIYAYIIADSDGNYISGKRPDQSSTSQEFVYVADDDCLMYINKFGNRDFHCVVTRPAGEGKIEEIEKEIADLKSEVSGVDTKINVATDEIKKEFYTKEAIDEKLADQSEVINEIKREVIGGKETVDHSNDAFLSTAKAWKVTDNSIDINESPSNVNSRAIEEYINLGADENIVVNTATYGIAIYAIIVTNLSGKVIKTFAPSAGFTVETYEYTAVEDCRIYINKVSNRDFSCYIYKIYEGEVESIRESAEIANGKIDSILVESYSDNRYDYSLETHGASGSGTSTVRAPIPEGVAQVCVSSIKATDGSNAPAYIAETVFYDSEMNNVGVNKGTASYQGACGGRVSDIPSNARYVSFKLGRWDLLPASQMMVVFGGITPPQYIPFSKRLLVRQDKIEKGGEGGSQGNICPYEYTCEKILCIGDSLTDGALPQQDWGEHTSHGNTKYNYPYFLSKMMLANVTNAGFGGKSASDWWQNYISNYNYAKYDTVIIWLGTNKGCVEMPTDAEIDNFVPSESEPASSANQALYLITIIKTIKNARPDIFLVLANVFASTTGVSKNNDVVAQIASKYNCVLVNTTDLDNHSQPAYHQNTDNPHFGKIGYIAVAHRFASTIRTEIASNPIIGEFGLEDKTSKIYTVDVPHIVK